jgi:NTE family protein
MDISLALGGGGAKGNCHIGVLRLLEEEGFRVRAIAGSSFGGMVACFFAAGYRAAQIEEIFAAVDQTHLYDRSREESSSLLGLSRVSKWLEQIFRDRTFADLAIPCAVTAVDLRTSREVILKKGRVLDAILSTIAIPGIFPSFLTGEFELVDGAMLNPVPVALARSLAPALPVVAVSLGTPLGEPPRSVPFPLLDGLPSPLIYGLSNLRVTKAFDIFMRSIDIGSRHIAELRFQIEKPDVIIHPEVDEIDALDRVDVHAVAKLGEIAARAKLPELRRATAWTTRLRHALLGDHR